MAADIITSLVYSSKKPFIGSAAYYLLKLLGIEFPRSVKIGKDLEITHGGFGIVVHSWTQIGDRVKVYPGVTIGRADVHVPITQSDFQGILIDDDVILSSGCKVVGRQGVLKIGCGTVLGANAVLLRSTGNWEIWAGVPAEKVGERKRL